jgi:cyclic pyranopterin phosphate synthase
MELTHLNKEGKAQMVDISQKTPTERMAVATGSITMAAGTLHKILENSLKKGDALAVARIAGILSAKKTDQLIPLCQSLPLSSVTVDFEEVGDDTLKITAVAKTFYQTGVEMESLTAVSVAALTIYDMAKAIDKGMQIGEIHLAYKEGGKSGTFDWDKSE